MSSHDGLTAGQVRRQTGVSRPQLRHWEHLGIISPVMESHASRVWRIYLPAEVEKIRRIVYMLSEGMTLRGAVRKLPALEAREKKLGRTLVPAGVATVATAPTATALSDGSIAV